MLKNTNLLRPVGTAVICLDTVDSTNNYAMQRIDAGLAAHGDVVLAARQTAGKGQRGKSWQDEPGKCLLMSIIVSPQVDLRAQPLFLAAIAVAAAAIVQRYIPKEKVTIKWPNDILIADKKAAGILIENVVRGAVWQWSVVGIGLNLEQTAFDSELPYATSLKMADGLPVTPKSLAIELASAIGTAVAELRESGDLILADYNRLLYHYMSWQEFRISDNICQLKILGMSRTGQLLLEDGAGMTEQYAHGSVEWIWG